MPDISPEVSFTENFQRPRIEELSMKAKSMCMILRLGMVAVAGLSAAGSKVTAKEKYIAIVKDEGGRTPGDSRFLQGGHRSAHPRPPASPPLP
jgi:hypothetical protein